MARHRVAAVAVLAVLAPLSEAALAADRAPKLVPHEAVYAIALARAGGGVLGASGRMNYRFADTCAGWTVETRNDLVLTDDRGSQVKTTWEFLSWEAKDGLSYRFRVHTTRDGEATEALEGSARLDGSGQAGEATFTAPEPKTFPMPAGTLFPTEHTEFLLRHAANGDRLVMRPVFDGSVLAPPFAVNAVIGAKLAPAPGELPSPLVSSRPSWPMHLAFFRSDSNDPLPYHEVAVRYHDNGVAERVVQDYGNFSLSIHLESISPLPPPDC